MFICGYHFPASMGNKISHEQVVERVTAEVGDLSDVSYAVLISENRDGIKQEDLRVEKKAHSFLQHWLITTKNQTLKVNIK